MDSRFRVVFRTGRVYELDIARNTLNEAGIPSYAQGEDVGGVVMAIPSSPTPGPGVWFNLLVPEERLAEARDALTKAPIDLDLDSAPDFWHFPSQRRRIGWRIYAALALLASAALALVELALSH